MTRKAFTLIELLVVVAIITLLIAILLPSLSKAREVARDLKCRTNLRTISMAFFMFAGDHKQVLPGGALPQAQGTQPWQQGWIGMEVDPNNVHMPWTRNGTLLPYLGDSGETARKLYRCPGLNVAEFGQGGGSNGLFDYANVLNFSGTHMSTLNNESACLIPETGESVRTIMPLILEEDPSVYINLHPHVEFSWGSYDQLAYTHLGGGNIAGVDGAVEHIDLKGGRGPNSFEWVVRAPSGNYATIAPEIMNFGEWNNR